jgi:hypothetical protein
MKDQRCETCFYFQNRAGMYLGECLFFQFLERSGSSPSWADPKVLPAAWRSPQEGTKCKAWDDRDHDIAEYNLPGCAVL